MEPSQSITLLSNFLSVWLEGGYASQDRVEPSRSSLWSMKLTNHWGDTHNVVEINSCRNFLSWDIAKVCNCRNLQLRALRQLPTLATFHLRELSKFWQLQTFAPFQLRNWRKLLQL